MESVSLWNAGCCTLCGTENLLIGITRWKSAQQLCWSTGKRGLVLLGMHISWPGLSPFKSCFHLWNSGWDSEHRVAGGGRGGGGGNVAGSFFWALNLDANVNCNEKKNHFFPRKTSDKDSKLDEQYETVVLKWQELIPAKEIVRVGFPFPFCIHISLMLLSREETGILQFQFSFLLGFFVAESAGFIWLKHSKALGFVSELLWRKRIHYVSDCCLWCLAKTFNVYFHLGIMHSDVRILGKKRSWEVHADQLIS